MERRHEFEPAGRGAASGLLARGLEILAMFDKIGAERPHGAVLLDRIAVRHVDRDRHAIAPRGVGEALAVIAARGRDNPGCRGPLALEPIDIDKPAAHLEGAGRRVVLVLDDNIGAEPLGKQRPAMRRRRRHRRADDAVGAFQVRSLEGQNICPLRDCSSTVTPAPCRWRTGRRRWRSRRLAWPPAAAFRCAPCPRESSGSSSPAPPPGNRTAPGA